MKGVIFDLDGTLVDSSPGILAAFVGAFADCGVSPVRPLTAEIIGPPLSETLGDLSGSTDPVLLGALATAFKAHYDKDGYRETHPFAGVDDMLLSLGAAGVPLYVATNKRDAPTRLILDHLGWTDRFAGIYALDAFSPTITDKAALIARLLTDARLDRENCAYMGDRAEDAAAARANGLLFFWAAWGFGAALETTDGEKCIYLASPDPRQVVEKLRTLHPPASE